MKGRLIGALALGLLLVPLASHAQWEKVPSVAENLSVQNPNDHV